MTESTAAEDRGFQYDKGLGRENMEYIFVQAQK